MTMNTETLMKEESPSASQEGGSNAPSGFILKLFHMVNGAPDEVISVSDSPSFSVGSFSIGGNPVLPSRVFVWAS